MLTRTLLLAFALTALAAPVPVLKHAGAAAGPQLEARIDSSDVARKAKEVFVEAFRGALEASRASPGGSTA